MTKENMKEYLNKIMILEIKKYEIEKTLNNFYAQLNKSRNILNEPLENELPEKLKIKEILSALSGDMQELFMIIWGIAALVTVPGVIILHFFSFINTDSIWEDLLLGAMVSGVFAFVVTVWVLIQTVLDSKNTFAKDKENIKKHNIIVMNNADTARKQIQILNYEILELKKSYNTLSETLKRLYEADIIYQKYRSLVPISAFYEYFCSGRCSQLEGHEGAYNIYENELIGKVIIGKLDVIIEKLDSIKANQYILYNAISESNRNINQLTNSVNNAVYHLQDISSKTDVIEYNSELAALNTNTIKWIEISNYLNG